MSSRTRQQLEKWVGKIKVPAMSKCLDVGGSQNPIQSRLGEKGENAEYKILDFAPIILLLYDLFLHYDLDRC